MAVVDISLPDRGVIIPACNYASKYTGTGPGWIDNRCPGKLQYGTCTQGTTALRGWVMVIYRRQLRILSILPEPRNQLDRLKQTHHQQCPMVITLAALCAAASDRLPNFILAALAAPQLPSTRLARLLRN